MGEKLFHRALFGYRRKDVNAYFESVSEKFAEEGRAKDAELARLRDALASAEREADALRGLREEFENSRNSISKAIIDAETNAVRIIEEAKKSAVEEKRKVQNEIAE
ncbi:MAG: DivIVA domain-containing protein, partial [Clostridiales bacterium]|nr:DivIVA domain-containing protein [Clostridiales bacterium]